jgi:hypothetical protein
MHAVLYSDDSPEKSMKLISKYMSALPADHVSPVKK